MKSVALFGQSFMNSIEVGKVFSPLSIVSLFSLIYHGSRNKTAEELQDVLFGVTPVETWMEIFENLHETSMVSIAQRAAVNNKFIVLEEFQSKMEKICLTTSEDFTKGIELEKKLNDFIGLNTKGLIKDLIKGLNDGDAMVLINTVYFKASWKYEFKESKTIPGPFLNSNNEVKEKPLMNLKENIPYYETDDYQMIELPYLTPKDAITGKPKKSVFSMGFILPKYSNDDKSYKKFTFLWPEIEENIERLSSKNEIDVTIPKFTQRSRYDLIPILKNMGITSLFNPSMADLKSISESADLYVSQAIHEAVVIVDEKGTEAAAATVVRMRLTSMKMPAKDPIIFKADHTFTYYIRHTEQNIILFLGHYDGE